MRTTIPSLASLTFMLVALSAHAGDGREESREEEPRDEEPTVTLTPVDPVVSFAPERGDKEKPYIPPHLVPLTLPQPPREATPDDVPPTWIIPEEPDDPFDDTPPDFPKLCSELAEDPETGALIEVMCCSHVTGWSFERTWEGWHPQGQNFERGPVFGNNVHIDRMLPDGYTNDAKGSPEEHVGGDYWAFSRDVNQQGNWWLGSSDFRPMRTQLPGMRWPEEFQGRVTSPLIRIDSNYVRFFIGGNPSFSQRVQLEVFPKDSETESDLMMLYDGIGVSEMQGYAPMLPLNATHNGAVVVRASAPKDDQEFMHRRVAWDVSELRGRLAYIVVIDESPLKSPVAVFGAHVNVDEVVCRDDLDDKVDWNVAEGVSPAVGQAETPIPVWGTTDTHTHPLVNFAFGSNLMWGDVGDELADVYDCSGSLPEIKSGDTVFRKEKHNVPAEDCSPNGFLEGLISGVVWLCPDPNCAADLWEIVDKLNGPLATGNSLHGSPSPLSGGLTLKPNLQGIVNKLDEVINDYAWLLEIQTFGEIDIPDLNKDPLPKHVHGLIERLAWDLDDGHHSKHNVKGHQFAQKDMILRAWQGGLRLMGVDVIDNRTLTKTLDLNHPGYDEWRTIEETVANMKRLVACENDPDGLDKGPLCDIAGIALSPADARMLIESNKIAIVLGVETDELGFKRTPDDTMEQQVGDLFKMGIRKVNAIHAMDNPLGGAAVFNDTYMTGTNELTNELDRDHVEQAKIDVTIALGSAVGDQPGVELKRYATDPSLMTIFGNWMQEHGGWFGLAEPSAPGTSWIGDDDSVTFRFGFDSMKTPLARADHVLPMAVDPWYHHQGTWGGVGEVHYVDRANTIIDANVGSMCSLDGAMFPLEVEVKPNTFGITDDMTFGMAHMNERGLSELGVLFTEELMKRGMMIDLDHLSQRAREDAYDLAANFGAVADPPEVFGDDNEPGEYPFFAVHTGIRHLTRHGVAADLPSYRMDRGYRTEDDRTKPEFARSRKHGGVFSPAFNASHLMENPNDPPDADDLASFEDEDGDGIDDPSTELDEHVRNDCDYSAKSFAVKYLWMVDAMGGRGITPSTDMSPFFKPAAPRYGQNQCHVRTSWREDMFDIDDSADHLDKWCAPDFGPLFQSCRMHSFPRDWDLPAANASWVEEKLCPIWGRMIPGCETHDVLQHQMTEGSAVEYVDYFDPDYAGDSRVINDIGFGIQTLAARRSYENRDDGAPRAHVDEVVGIGGARQMWPMKKMKTDAGNVNWNTGWDINLDGMVHIGLMPDFLQDVRNVGVSWERLTPMFNAAEDYVRMWERQCELANSFAQLEGRPPVCE